MRLLAPAKINLHLRVGPRRDDGFHPLLTWMCTVGLFDTLELTLQNPAGRRVGGDAGFLLATDDPQLPTDARNLVVRGAQAMADHARRLREGIAVGESAVSAFLYKRIPAGAGLGGGSSDAARAMLGLARLWDWPGSTGELASLAVTIGSDLPFFFHGPSSICTGRGEAVTPLRPPAAKWAMLALPDIAMPTPAVYAKFDEMGLGDADAIEHRPDFESWAAGPAETLLRGLVNDLEAPAFALRPDLGALRERVEQSLGRPVRMSGSGSSLFTLYDARPDAEYAAGQIRERHAMDVRTVEVAPLLPDDLADDMADKQDNDAGRAM
jgi:4-diphosphocytidyl-2-C-methyl-D-erythritol kinase